MTTREELLSTLAPILEAVRALDLSKPEDAARSLAQQFPLEGAFMHKVRAQVRNGVVEGWLADRTATDGSGVRFSRVVKDAGGLSVDVVHMSGPAGGGHTHPNGEVDLCFAVDDPTRTAAGASPRFDGKPAGFTVYAPNTWHVPTVAGGAMDILYFLPGGAIVFGAQS
ncbi:MAG TPA: DUF4863 family protein [Myxococcota bacterium]|jgi:hypothetical protein